ncbi:hypothetical protein [Paenibacillus sp. FSL R10-2771]|uniref:hypothetical protein n=1 Tax=Paenibacillus sp. FSL R10-2771 TaxID=2954693 RepID=UPI0030FBC0AE
MATTLGNGVVDYNTAAAEAKKKLVQNQLKINNDPGYVASEQQRALQVIAQRQAQGLDTSGQQKYLTQQLGYKAPAANTAAASTPTAATTSSPKSNAQQGSDYMSQMAAIAQRQATPFSYDPNSDPAYQAALTRAKANIADGTAQTEAELNRRGLLNSTITSDRSAEIGAQEMGNVETTVLPQLMQQAYQKYIDNLNQQQQQFSNLGTVANSYLGEDQRAIDNTNTTAGLTGNLPGGEQAQQLYSQLLNLKQQAEAKGITAADRSKLSNQADGIRAMLSTMGVDISKLGANTNSVTAGQITPTIRTLAGQNQDLAAQNQTFNQATQTRQLDTADKQYGEQFEYQKARDAITDQQWKKSFDEDYRRYGLDYALQEQQNRISAQNANTSQASASSSITGNTFNRYLDIWKATGTAPSGLEAYGVEAGSPWYEGAQSIEEGGLTINQVVDNIKSIYQEPIVKKELDTWGKMIETDTGKTKITSDPTQRKKMFDNVVDSGLGNNETLQALNSLGFTKAEIQKFYDEGIQSSGE